jgi:hypothetical protein
VEGNRRLHLAYRAVRSQEVLFYSRQRYRREPSQTLHMPALNVASNRGYDGTQPPLNEAAKHFFGDPPASVSSPVDAWSFEFPKPENGQQRPSPFSALCLRVMANGTMGRPAVQKHLPASFRTKPDLSAASWEDQASVVSYSRVRTRSPISARCVTYCYARGKLERLPEPAADLIRLKVEVIVASSTAGLPVFVSTQFSTQIEPKQHGTVWNRTGAAPALTGAAVHAVPFGSGKCRI